MSKQPLEITPNLTVHALLEAYPELQDVLIRMAPPFKRLRNPILRRSVAKIATLKQAAVVGRVPLSEMISTLRVAVGQPPTDALFDASDYLGDRPDWCSPESVSSSLNAEEVDSNQMPVTRLLQLMRRVEAGGIVELETSFLPAPAIDAMKAKGYNVWCSQPSADEYRSYFKKVSRP